MAYKKTSMAIVLSLVLTLIVAIPAYAADVTVDSTNLSLTINQGNFTLTVDPTAGLHAITVSTIQQQTYTGLSAGNDTSDILVEVDDARGANTPAGWSVTATISELAQQVAGSPTGIIIPVTNFSNNFSTVTPATGTDITNVSAGTGSVITDATTVGDGVSDAFSVMVASSGYGQGNYQLDMGFDLIVDPNQEAGSYTGEVIVTRI